MLPNLIIIGAAKCGTTSLHRYLSLHPEIFMSQVTKEPSFFVQERTWTKGLDWYKSLFPETAKIIGEASTNYTKYPAFKGVPERMSLYIPEAKLIYLVQDPIDQMVSHWMEARATHWTKESFEEAFANLEENYYVSCARYFLQIDQYLKFFSKENILIIDSTSLRKERIKTLKTIFNFLGVNVDFEHPDFFIEHNQSVDKVLENKMADIIRPIPLLSRLRGKFPSLFIQPMDRPVISQSLRASLTDLVREDVEELRAFTGMEFKSWSV